MPLGLLKYGLRRKYPAQHHFPRPKELKKTYDVVIIGGGGHGLATAYLSGARPRHHRRRRAREGLSRRRQHRAQHRDHPLQLPDARRRAFYDELVRLFQDLSNDFDLNIMYSERGHLTLAHTDAAIRTSRWRAEVNKHLGVDSELV